MALRALIAAGGALGCLYWFLSAALFVRARRALRDLADVTPRPGNNYPLVSLVVPARNEAETLQGAVESRLANDYPSLEMILVDDRSTDATPAVVDGLAARHANVRPLHLTALPEGWLGKLHAMDQGTRLAHGEWLLFSDADIHFAPGTLRRAITWAEERGLDHLAVFPGIVSRGFWISAVVSGFARSILTVGRAWGVEDPKSTAYMGVGAFNLVRRSAWETTKGFAWLRLELIDDMGVGMLMKESGYRSGVISGTKVVTVEWYPNLGAMIVASERAAFSLCNYNLARVVIAAGAILLLELGPWLALLPLGIPGLPFLGLAAIAIAWICSISANRWVGAPALPALLVFGGTVLQVWMLLRAGILGVRRGGIFWRGTLYPLSALREGRRVKLG